MKMWVMAGAEWLAQYRADGGMKDFGLALMGLFHLSETWHTGGSVMYKRLLGDAEDSPLVDDRGGLAVPYSWWNLTGRAAGME